VGAGLGRAGTEFGGERFLQRGELGSDVLVQRMQPRELDFSFLSPFTDRLLNLEALLLGPHARFIVKLSGLPMRFAQCALGVLSSAISTLANRHLTVIELDFPLCDFVVELGGTLDERLLNLMAVRLGVLARPFELRGCLPRGAATHVSCFFLGRAKQLLDSVAEAGLSAWLFRDVLELGLERPKLSLGLIRSVVLALVRGL
jgi:hypothetical protein